eukprot:CAMPEP_0119466748 /NCGR_PEP_ID=MMETSP1344-20130328/1261_1 /TAXON_ID=236787 /ORGANISM="Florenciella parvula, Strain CCMP2471" /LENGTH=174 /DNA_ID=CAMNT_0007499079 /DNA_START=203 /DNA_END=724 /DNA_ORIENTATION=+
MKPDQRRSEGEVPGGVRAPLRTPPGPERADRPRAPAGRTRGDPAAVRSVRGRVDRTAFSQGTARSAGDAVDATVPTREQPPREVARPDMGCRIRVRAGGSLSSPPVQPRYARRPPTSLARRVYSEVGRWSVAKGVQGGVQRRYSGAMQSDACGGLAVVRCASSGDCSTEVVVRG